MPATTTLSTTTLAGPVTTTAGEIKLTSSSGLVTGTRLYVDRELMSVVSVGVSTAVYTLVKVSRGVDGTVATAHYGGATVTIGTASQFYASDPVGLPPSSVLVSPWINVMNGKIWYAQGDSLPSGNANRWWQEVTTTYGVGALGVRTKTSDPTVGT